ncbi:MAG: protein-tyrosine phosphatase family protein [Gammaproteobacteria bacterium]
MFHKHKLDLGDTSKTLSSKDESPFVLLFKKVRGKKPHPTTHYCYWRFKDSAAIQDPKFPHYPVTTIQYKANKQEQREAKQHYLHEGPNQVLKHSNHASAFFKEVLINPTANVSAVLVLGKATDGRDNKRTVKGFLDYFTPESIDKETLEQIEKELNIKISRKKVAGDDGVEHFEITISPGVAASPKSLKEPKVINVYQLPIFEDFGTLIQIKVPLIQKLLKIHLSEGNLSIHCSAGLGRTGAIELAYVLFDNYEKFYGKNGEPDFKAIHNTLEELRILRPSLVQEDGQYEMAIALGMKLHLADAANKGGPEFTQQISDEIDVRFREAARSYNKKMMEIKEEKTSDGLIQDIDKILGEQDLQTVLTDYLTNKKPAGTGGVGISKREPEPGDSAFKARDRRRRKTDAVKVLIQSLHTLQERSKSNEIDSSEYLVEVVNAIQAAKNKIDNVSEPTNFSKTKSFFKKIGGKPGSSLQTVINTTLDNLEKQFALQLGIIQSNKEIYKLVNLTPSNEEKVTTSQYAKPHHS